MIVYDLNSGHREYPGYDEIEDRRGGGRGRSRIKRHGAMSNMSLQCTIRMVFRRSSNVRTSW